VNAMTMTDTNGPTHTHIFLGEGHDNNERRTWLVIWLCGLMMIAEIVGGMLFGSIALIADGLHMSTHAGALLLAALAYRYARRHADDRRFTFGTGKLGDLAGFTSAIVLAMIALLICYEAISRWPSISQAYCCWAAASTITIMTTIMTATRIGTTTPTTSRQASVRRSMSTLTGRRIATTICGPPSSTSLPMPRFRCWSLSGCCWRGSWVGSGWTRSPACAAPSSSRHGHTD